MEIFNKINDAFNKLIISRHSLGMQEIGRRKLFILFMTIMNVGLLIFGTQHFINGFYKNGIINYSLVILLTFIIIFLRSLISVLYIFRFVTLLLAIVLCFWIRTGGPSGYSGIWGLLFPLFSFFLLGKKEGLIWTFLFIIIITFLFINPYSLITGYTYPAQYISRYIFLLLMILLFTYNYESIREKYETEMKAEIKVRQKAEDELRSHRDNLEEIVRERTLEIEKNSEKLEASEKRYRLMADNVNDMIWATDLKLKFFFISPSVFRMYGYTVDEAMKLTPDKWNTPESFSRLIKAYQNEIALININPEKTIILQLEQIKKDGTVFPVELKVSSILDENGAAIGIVGITRDISDRIAMELEREKIKEQLAHSQKMEALGTLVGGLAHDFNNFLSGIIGSFDLLSLALKDEKLNKKDYIEKYLNLGMESSKRSSGLINQLLILSKRHEIKFSTLDIKKSLNHIHELCRNSFPKSIELNFLIDEAPLVINGDMVQIEQVLLNLCINASHSMTIMQPSGVKHGGVLTVTAGKVKSDDIIEENLHEIAGIVDHWVRIKILDTGVGIDNDTMQRIFEPFFSTKSQNESTGLGLAISYNIIKKHGGIVNVNSEPGSGSCFSIYFPVYSDGNKVLSEDVVQEIEGGSETVLVIDDELLILNIAKGFLKHCGYDVITAEGADKGIEIYKKEYTRISAVLLDLSMPGKSGLEVFQELKKINSNVKAVLSSGMLDSETRDIAIKMGVTEIVNKPYTINELSAIMKKVISVI